MCVRLLNRLIDLECHPGSPLLKRTHAKARRVMLQFAGLREVYPR